MGCRFCRFFGKVKFFSSVRRKFIDILNFLRLGKIQRVFRGFLEERYCRGGWLSWGSLLLADGGSGWMGGLAVIQFLRC
jgi:hypothetical protein